MRHHDPTISNDSRENNGIPNEHINGNTRTEHSGWGSDFEEDSDDYYNHDGISSGHYQRPSVRHNNPENNGIPNIHGNIQNPLHDRASSMEFPIAQPGQNHRAKKLGQRKPKDRLQRKPSEPSILEDHDADIGDASADKESSKNLSEYNNPATLQVSIF